MLDKLAELQGYSLVCLGRLDNQIELIETWRPDSLR
jgi:hypothetical protein